MATLEKIRNRSKLLFGIIAFALLAFVLGDLFNSGGALFNSSRTEIGVVDGESIQYQDYLAKENELNELYKSTSGQIDEFRAQQIRTQAWEELIHRAIMTKQYDEIGLGVATEELYDMVQGSELDPAVRQIFTNPQTGQINKTQILQFIKAVSEGTANESQKAYWLYLERDIKKRREFKKYLNLVNKGLNVTTAEAKADFEQRQYLVDFDYVVKPYSAISDNDVQVSDSEISDYYNKHKEDYKQEATRDLEYVAFEIVASNADIAATQKTVADLKGAFEKTDDDARFVGLNSEQPFQERFFKKGDLDANIDSIMFDAETGYVHGPYKDRKTFKLAKLIERKQLPDSVKASHILLRVDASTSLEQAKAKVDSLKGLVEKGASFADLAKEHGTDGTKEKGGDLGWFKQNTMVKPFNDAAFAANDGDLFSVETQFGVHLVQMTGIGEKSEMIKVGFITHNIEPSTETFENVYGKANRFAAENSSTDKFEPAIKAQGLVKRTASRLREIDNRIAGLESPRELVRWAFKEDTEVGSFSPVYEFGNKFVIATLKTVREEGHKDLAEVSNEISRKLKKDKKAEKLIAEMTGAATLDGLAGKLSLEAKEAKNISFASRQIPGAGIEPAVIGKAVKAEKDKATAPIKGINGVYVLQVKSITNPKFENPSYKSNKTNLERTLQNRASYEAYNALKEKAEVEDKRGKFL